MPNRDIASQRRDYVDTPLNRTDLDDDPMRQLADWLAAARDSGIKDPTAMTLATVDAQGRPQARIVLLKGLDEGLLFYGHGLSHKGRALALNPQAAVVFHWDTLDRQVRVEGRIERVARADTCRYFASRPRDSQLAALISRQSWPVPDRQTLETALAQARQRLAGQAVPCPPGWHGWRLLPETIEFWQGRPGRLHDRFLYRRRQGRWRIERLAP